MRCLGGSEARSGTIRRQNNGGHYKSIRLRLELRVRVWNQFQTLLTAGMAGLELVPTLLCRASVENLKDFAFPSVYRHCEAQGMGWHVVCIRTR